MKQWMYAILLGCCLTAPPLQAQYWKRVFDTPGQNEWPRGIAALPDGGCVFVGSKHAPTTDWDITVTRLDATGNIAWTRTIATPNVEQGHKIQTTSDGQLMVLAKAYESATSKGQIQLTKIETATGNPIWSRSYGSNEDDVPGDLIELPDGDWAVSGTSQADDTQSRAFMFRTDPQGQLRWFNYYSPSIANEALISLKTLPDGSLLAVGGSDVFKNYSNGIVVKAKADGTQIFKQTLDYGKGEYLSDIFPLANGRLLCTGMQQGGGVIKGLLVRMEANGMAIDSHLTEQPIYDAVQFAPDSIGMVGAYNAFNGAYFQVADTLGRAGRIYDLFTRNATIAFAVTTTADNNGFFVATDEAPVVFATSERSILYKMSRLGRTDEYFIEGRVTHDEDGDCAYTQGEAPLKDWAIQATDSNGSTWVATTDADGRYTITVPFDSFVVSVLPPTLAWQSCGPYWVTLPAGGNTAQQDISALSLGEYASLSIDIGATALRNGQPNPLTIEVRNNGITAADSATVKFSYDPRKARVVGASLMDSLRLAPDTLLFRIPPGALAPEQAFSFVVSVELLPTPVPNQTYQFRADAAAKNDLLQTWEGAIVQVKGRCEGDSVAFDLKNIGAAMQDALEYIVIEDNVMGRAAPFQLPKDGVRTIKFPANGSTWRLVAPQEEGFPFGKFSTHAIEGCLKPGSGAPISTGYVGQFPEADAAPQTAIYTATVLEIEGMAYKTAFPTGCGDEHRLAPETELEYQIGFELPDSVRATAILDTLPAALDPSSFTAGAGYYPYRHEVTTTPEGLTVIRFWWDTLQPQRGFVRFRIRQRQGIAMGTTLWNKATVYGTSEHAYVVFSETNSVEHRVDTGGCLRIVSATLPEPTPHQQWVAFPNPATDLVFFQYIAEGEAPNLARISVFNMIGQLVQASAPSPLPTLHVAPLPSGLYLVVLETRQGHKTAVKLKIEN